MFNATKAAPSGNKWAGNMLMIHVDVKQGLVLKTTRFNDSESTLFLLRDDNFIHGALSDLTLFSFTYCMNDHLHKYIIGTL